MEDSVIEDVPKQSSSWPIYLYIPNLIGKQFSNVVMAPDPFLVVLLPKFQHQLRLIWWDMDLVSQDTQGSSPTGQRLQ